MEIQRGDLMRKKKLFGLNIKPSCAYCHNAAYKNDIFFCNKGQTFHGGKCRSFKYNPLMRVPMSVSLKNHFNVDDFKL